MALLDPVKVYAAASNLDAQLVSRMLLDSGIEAFAGEDTSPVGWSLLGPIAGVFDAGVFVSRADSDRAISLIRHHELLGMLRDSGTGSEVEVICEECGQKASFPAGKRGTVENCPHCRAMIDVPEADASDDVSEEHEELGIRRPPDETTTAPRGE